jgi:hypothetical protein
LTRKNPTEALKKSRVKIVFPVSIAAKIAAGCAVVSGTADANRDSFNYSPGVRMALDRRQRLLAITIKSQIL